MAGFFNSLTDTNSGMTPNINSRDVGLVDMLNNGAQGQPIDFQQLMDIRRGMNESPKAQPPGLKDLMSIISEGALNAGKINRENPRVKGLSALLSGSSDATYNHLLNKPKEKQTKEAQMMQDLTGLMSGERKNTFDRQSDERKYNYQKEKLDKDFSLKEALNAAKIAKENRLGHGKATAANKLTPKDSTALEEMIDTRLSGDNAVALEPVLKQKMMSDMADYYKESGNAEQAFQYAVQNNLGNVSNLRDEEFVTKEGLIKDDVTKKRVKYSPQEINRTRAEVEAARSKGFSNSQIKELLKTKGLSKTVMKELGL